jgi:hypothetical protein
MFSLQQSSDIQAATGEQVVLSLKSSDGKGQILFGESSYGSVQLVPEGGIAPQTTFTVQSGRQKLELFFFFVGADSGELLEQIASGSTQHVSDIFASEPTIRLFIQGA